MHVSAVMGWRVYTKRVVDGNCIAMRWYWCTHLPHGKFESPVGFTTRPQCEADAIKHGCRPHDQEKEQVHAMTRLLDGGDASPS